MKKRYLRLAALTAGVLLTAQTGLSAAALSTFDAAYYAAQYPDVAAVCGNDEGALLRHYLDHGIDEGRKPSADGIAGDDELSLTEAQFSSVWSPVAINKLAHYKSLKRKCTDEEFSSQFAGKTADGIEYVKGGGAQGDNQIDAISGATITTNAVTQGVNSALDFYNNCLKEG